MLKSGAKSALVNTLFLSASNVFGLLVKAVYVGVLASALGPELYGLFAYALAFYVLFLPLANFGLSGILIREIGSQRVGKRDLVNSLYAVRLLLLIVTVAGYGIVSALIEDEPQTLTIKLILVFALVGRSLSLWNEGVFTGLEKTQETLKLQGVWRTTEALIGIALLTWGAGLVAIVVVHALSWVLQAGIGQMRSSNLLGGYSPSLSLAGFLKVAHQAWPLAAAGVLVSWSLQGPIVLFRNFGDSEMLGQMALGYQVFGFLMIIPTSLGTASLPVLTRSVDRGDKKDEIYLSVTFRASLLVSGLIGCVVMALAGPFFQLVFDDRYELAAELAGYFIWLLAPFSIASTLRALALSRKRFKDVLTNSIVGAVIFTVVALATLQDLGVYGIFLGALLGYTTSAITTGWSYVRHLHDEQVRAIFSALLTFVLTAGAAILADDYHWLLQLCAGFFALLTGSVALRVLTESETSRLRALLAAKFPR